MTRPARFFIDNPAGLSYYGVAPTGWLSAGRSLLACGPLRSPRDSRAFLLPGSAHTDEHSKFSANDFLHPLYNNVAGVLDFVKNSCKNLVHTDITNTKRMILYKNPQRIGQIREIAGLSQTVLAKRMDVSPSLISHWESGVRTPSECQIFELARALGVTPDYLLNAAVSPVFQFRARVSLPSEDERQLLKDASQQVYFVDAVFKIAGKNLKPFGLRADFDHEQLSNLAGQFREAFRLNRHVTLGELKEALREWNVFVFEWAMPISVSGLSYRGATTVIIINAQHTPERKLFTLAHELAHVLFHLGKDQDTVVSVIASNRDPQEKEANKFATELLMSSSDIDRLIKDYGSSLRQPVILGMAAKMFNVSSDAMFYRLTQRGIFRWTEKVKYLPAAPKEAEKPEYRVIEINDQVGKEFLRTAVSLYESEKASIGKLAEWFFAPRAKVDEYLASLTREQENGICCEDV